MTKRFSEYILDDLRGEKKHLNNEREESIRRSCNVSNESGKLEHFIKNFEILQGLKRKGIKSLFPVQYETFETIFQGRDVIVKDRTGSGKTLAFVLPILERFLAKDVNFQNPGACKFLIILPTRYCRFDLGNWRSKFTPKFRVSLIMRASP